MMKLFITSKARQKFLNNLDFRNNLYNRFEVIVVKEDTYEEPGTGKKIDGWVNADKHYLFDGFIRWQMSFDDTNFIDMMKIVLGDKAHPDEWLCSNSTCKICENKIHESFRRNGFLNLVIAPK